MLLEKSNNRNLAENVRKHVWGPSFLQKWNINFKLRGITRCFCCNLLSKKYNDVGFPTSFKSKPSLPASHFPKLDKLMLCVQIGANSVSCYFEWTWKSVCSSVYETHFFLKFFGCITNSKLTWTKKEIWQSFLIATELVKNTNKVLLKHQKKKRLFLQAASACFRVHPHYKHQLLLCYWLTEASSSQKDSWYKH